MTLFEALTGGAFDRLNWQHSEEFDQNFSKKSNARGFARGGMGGFGIDRYITTSIRLQNSRIFCERERRTIFERKIWSECENGEGEW